ncbi:MAG: ankyrin repeat domain-containing protein [Nitratireductor sp.]
MPKILTLCVAALFAVLVHTPTLSGQSMTELSGLHEAAAGNDVTAIRALLSAGADIDARDDQGRTALLVAAHGNKVEAAAALIEAGANVNAKDDIDDSPYLYAGARGHLEILKMTLAHGADLQSTNRYGGTALIPAAERGHVETVRTLIMAGVEVDHINNLGWTALLEAVILGNGGPAHRRIVALLVGAGADVYLADRDGVTPLAHALGRGYEEIAQLLVEAGARGGTNP